MHTMPSIQVHIRTDPLYIHINKHTIYIHIYLNKYIYTCAGERHKSKSPIPSKTDPICCIILGGQFPLLKISKRAAFDTK
jgi:hypothetical protein